MHKVAYMLVLAFLCISALMTGCSGARLMMPTPNVYLDSEQDVYADLSAPLKSTEVPLFYITDRAPEQDEEGNLRYGSGRSNSLAFGKTVVDLGVASQLFESPRGRVGTVELEDLDETLRLSMQSAIKQLPARFAIVNFAGAADTEKSQRDRYGHSYFRDAPTVSSDLVLMLRDDLDPGTPGRPLERVGLRFWKIPPGYPDVQPAQ